jgi:hypothetical protein
LRDPDTVIPGMADDERRGVTWDTGWTFCVSSRSGTRQRVVETNVPGWEDVQGLSNKRGDG